MIAVRFRWHYLTGAVLCAIWLLTVWRLWERHPSKPPGEPPPVARAASQPSSCPLGEPAAAPIAPAPVAAPAAPAPVAAPAAPAPVAASVDPAAVAEAQTVHDKVWSAVPSVTSDGSQIFVPFSFSQGASGAVDYVWDLWNHRGKRVQHMDFKCAGPAWDYCPHDSVADVAQVRAQELAAAKVLAELELQGLHPLKEGVVDRGSEGPEASHASFTAEGDPAPSLTVDLSETGVLTIRPRDHAAITRQSSAWRMTPTPEEARQMQARLDEGKEACFNPATLRAPLVDVARRVAVVTIGYRGNDTCWEPSDDYIVVAW